MDIYKLFISTDYDQKVNSFCYRLQYLFSDEFQKKVLSALENFELLIEGFQKLPEKVQLSAIKWAEYGWVPCLPEYNAIDILNAIQVPKTKELADKEMLSALDSKNLNHLFDRLREYVSEKNHNSATLTDAIGCFQNGFYTGCSLSLFALIDACFVIGQPKRNEKERRALARKALDKKIKDSESAKYLVIAKTTKKNYR